jgi:hypothetical protein
VEFTTSGQELAILKNGSPLKNILRAARLDFSKLFHELSEPSLQPVCGGTLQVESTNPIAIGNLARASAMLDLCNHSHDFVNDQARIARSCQTGTVQTKSN